MKKFAKENPEELFAAILLVVTTVLVLCNVFLRYFLKTGIYWTEEVATNCFVWAIFVGGAGAYRNGAQLGVDLLVNWLPMAGRKLAKLLVQILLTVIHGYILYLSVIYVMKTHAIATSTLGVSSAYVSAALPVGFFLCTIYSLQKLWRLVQKLRKGETI